MCVVGSLAIIGDILDGLQDRNPSEACRADVCFLLQVYMPQGTPAFLWRVSSDDVEVVPRSRVPQEALMPEVGAGRSR